MTVATTLAEALDELGASERAPTHLTVDPVEAPDVRVIDWPAFPVRIESCLGRDRALRLLDWRPDGAGDSGRIAHQEEYAEWRLIGRDDELRGIELTSEFREYWQVLAAHEPERTLELVAQFAGERPEDVDRQLVYGHDDPLALDPQERERGFANTMLATSSDGSSPYNDGRRAICCMLQETNSLTALIALVASSARPHLVRDPESGDPRYATGSEAIAGLQASAQDGRNSDPLLVERIVRFATEGRRVGVDDPLGVYIRELQLHELAQPDGEDVPRDWLELSRGLDPATAPDGRQRYQRLRLELPADADFALSDLVVRRTGEPLRFGGQLAALVELAAYLRTGPSVDPADGPLHESERPPPDCEAELRTWAAFEASEALV